MAVGTRARGKSAWASCSCVKRIQVVWEGRKEGMDQDRMNKGFTDLGRW